jgi:hypothetical protein
VLLVGKPFLAFLTTIYNRLEEPYAPPPDALMNDAVKAEGIAFKEFIKCSYSLGTFILLTFYQLRLYKYCFKLSRIKLGLCIWNPLNQSA